MLGRPALRKIHPLSALKVFDNSFDIGKYLAKIDTTSYRTDENGVKVGTAFTDDIKARLEVYDYEEGVLAQLATCEKKAFVGSAEEIDDFLKFNKNKVKLVRGKEKFLSHGFAWHARPKAGAYLRRRISQVISSGIYHAWEDSFYAKTRDELDISLKKTIETKQSLDTNLGALFKIIILAWSCCLGFFFIEVLLSSKKHVWHLCLGVKGIVVAAGNQMQLAFSHSRLQLQSTITNIHRKIMFYF
jgi:hypothetical protein